jgi:hypothetical protein
MKPGDSREQEFLRAILDASPNFMFVVDEDVRIIEFNRTAGPLLSGSRDQVLRQRGGDILNCIHSKETPEGCGQAPFCKHCIVRDSVQQAFRGQRVIRRKTRLDLLSGGESKPLFVLVTASPFQYGGKQLALLVIEDMTELAELRRVIPICAKCKKIRNDEQYWADLESYFKSHWDMDFTHGLCPGCLQDLMEEIKRSSAEPVRK